MITKWEEKPLTYWKNLAASQLMNEHVIRYYRSLLYELDMEYFNKYEKPRRHRAFLMIPKVKLEQMIWWMTDEDDRVALEKKIEKLRELAFKEEFATDELAYYLKRKHKEKYRESVFGNNKVALMISKLKKYRSMKEYDKADAIRNELKDAHIEVRIGKDGKTSIHLDSWFWERFL